MFRWRGDNMAINSNSLDYINTVKASIIRPKFKLSLLNQNETVKEEIIDDIISGGGSLSINYQQGQRRSLNFALKNDDGKWLPNDNNGGLWINSKFKLELGIENDEGYTYWQPNGVFVVANPSATNNGGEKLINIQCYDKFAMLDGTLGGTITATYTIPNGSNIKQAITDILLDDNGNGYPNDIVPLIFDNIYKDVNTTYTITKNANSNLGEIIIELANMIACDVYYNENGNLVIQSVITDISNLRKPILWNYDDGELEYLSSTTSYDFTNVKNKVTVVGANVNSVTIYSAYSENNNGQSPTRIGKIGIRNLYIEDSNISSNQLCQDRADYELSKISILNLAISMESTYMIHLDVNKCISITDNFYGYKNQRFIIKSLNIPIGIDSKISIECANVASLPYYPSA